MHNQLPMFIFFVLGFLAVIYYMHYKIKNSFLDLAQSEGNPKQREEEILKLTAKIAILSKNKYNIFSTHKPIAKTKKNLHFLFITSLIITICLLMSLPLKSTFVWLLLLFAIIVLILLLYLFYLKHYYANKYLELLQRRATLYKFSKEYELSKKDLLTVLSIAPWNDICWAELAEDYMRLSDFNNAQKAAWKAYYLDDNYTEYYGLLAYTAHDKLTVDRVYSQLIKWEIDKNNISEIIYKYLLMSLLEFKLNNKLEASKTLEEAFSLDEEICTLIINNNEYFQVLHNLREFK